MFTTQAQVWTKITSRQIPSLISPFLSIPQAGFSLINQWIELLSLVVARPEFPEFDPEDESKINAHHLLKSQNQSLLGLFHTPSTSPEEAEQLRQTTNPISPMNPSDASPLTYTNSHFGW